MIDIFDSNVTSPIERLSPVSIESKSIELYVKREDLLHPTISGNKWRKLKYNLKYAKDSSYETVITFGGAFSNHIYATAAACQAIGLKSVGILRGEFDANNPTTNFARSCGMDIRYIDRASYRNKEHSPAAKAILSEYSNHFLIPEGGSNDLAQKGIQELSDEINATDFDVILVSAGTGATASGILQGIGKNKHLWVFSSLKSDYLEDEILQKVDSEKHHQLKFINSYHYGGYGKSPRELINFINDFKAQTNVPLDPIYNGKLMAGFSDLAQKDTLSSRKSYLWIHTGGLQGISAYNYMAAKRHSRDRIH